MKLEPLLMKHIECASKFRGEFEFEDQIVPNRHKSIKISKQPKICIKYYNMLWAISPNFLGLGQLLTGSTALRPLSGGGVGG